jgi:thiamine biosynthesis lipoprotein
MAPASASSQLELQRERGFWRASFAAMANPCEILCETSDEAIVRRIGALAMQEAARIERKFSRYRSDSIVHTINTGGGQPLMLDDETADLIDFGATLWQLSEGAFDLTSGVLRHAWRFDSRKALPSASTVAALRGRIGWQRVSWRRPELILPEGMEIDFGGIGKEYAVDRAVALIQTAADKPVLVNFGGDLRAAGAPPREGAWQVGIESAAAPGRASQVIRLGAGALATSGATRHFIEVNGKRYGHIIDARTGWPTTDAPRSVTVAADTCSQAGVFTTLAMLQGANAEEFLKMEGVQFWCLR